MCLIFPESDYLRHYLTGLFFWPLTHIKPLEIPTIRRNLKSYSFSKSLRAKVFKLSLLTSLCDQHKNFAYKHLGHFVKFISVFILNVWAQSLLWCLEWFKIQMVKCKLAFCVSRKSVFLVHELQFLQYYMYCN